jgi:hypothetical protein
MMAAARLDTTTTMMATSDGRRDTTAMATTMVAEDDDNEVDGEVMVQRATKSGMMATARCATGDGQQQQRR